ncbi:signal transduction histidine kinase [Duganella sp. 1224]|uniref:ATP-binding protein n=1 Tax=Duganella sp. 1224 TaxID=2587052 RepID=UPI0015CC6562|nr:ATP-binding protein [Duganella sp. 1224]NYE59520.1 signal transduction histidine kinase [Duganella sp. 1224]
MFINIQDVTLRRQLLIAIALVAMATGLQLLLSLLIGARAPFLIFVPTAALASALLGWPAAAVVLGGGVAYGIYILGPTYQFWIDDPADRIVVAAFLAVGVLFSGLGAAVRRVARRAALAERALADERLSRERDTLANFQEMFDQAPGFMTMLRGPEHVYVLENESHRHFHGHRQVIGQPIRRAFPELEGQGILATLDEAYRTGIPRTAYDVPLQLRRQPHGALDQLYMDLVCQPVRDKDGRVTGIFVEGFDVTEKKAMRDALRESHLRLQQGLSAARMAMWVWDLASDRVAFFDNAETVFHASRAELDGGWDVIDRDDQARLASLRAAALAAGGAAVETVQRTLPDREPLWLELRAAPAAGPDGVVTQLRGIAIDVSLQKNAERRAVEHETQRRLSDAKATAADQRLQLAVDAAGLGIFYCPLPLDAIYWNATCKAQFFLPPDAEIDIDLFYRLIAEEDRPRVREAIRRAVEEQADYDVEYRTLAGDGRSRWIRAKGRVYLDGEGLPARFDGITIDIQQQKESEAALQAANRHKDDFLAMLAHELRNPLAPISSAAGLLMRIGHGDEHMLRMSQVIDRQVKHMAGLLDDLLDVSRVTRGKIELERATVDLKATLAGAAEQVLPLIRRRAHQLTMHLTPERTMVSGDEKRLVQVFVNLLTNAARYTAEGGVIDLQLSVEDGQAVVRVRDNGIGLNSELIPRLFDLFVQGERGIDRQQGGLGIGLSLVKRLTELHGGAVAVHSAGPAKGSLFTVRLPLLAAGPGAAAGQPPPSAAAPAARRIIIVDDNEDAAQALAAVLRVAGHTVRVEHDPLAALERAVLEPAEVFLLDIGMPVMDGYTLARHLREHAATRDARIIAVTGYGQEQDRRHALAAGFDALLVKPVDHERLAALLVP